MVTSPSGTGRENGIGKQEPVSRFILGYTLAIVFSMNGVYPRLGIYTLGYRETDPKAPLEDVPTSKWHFTVA